MEVTFLIMLLLSGSRNHTSVNCIMPILSRLNPDYYPATVVNYKLGGSFSGVLNMILREEKGYTYGARSNFNEQKEIAPFIASSSVRSSATLESVNIFRTAMEDYRQGISQDDLEFTKNALIK